MSSQPSQTRIANRALTLIGTGKRLIALDESSPEGRTMLSLFADARDSVLVDHPWNIAVRRAAIPAEAKPPAFGASFAYTLPTDCLRWLPDRSGAFGYPVEQEGNLLLTDAPAPLRIRYIGRVDDVGTWTQGMLDALAYRLAAEGAEPLTADKGDGDRLMQRYQAALSRAKRQDGMATGDTRGGEDTAASSWLAARWYDSRYDDGWSGW
jgi:hypothetical protein